MNLSVLEAFLHVISMLGVGFLEEIIFRGFLFKAMSKTSVKSAILVSSLTFGMGHIVNLLNGRDVLETLLQLCYACAIGFVFVIIFRYLEQKSKTNPDIFLDYMGDNVDLDAICEEQHACQILKKLGGERTTQYKNKFYHMAKEFEDTNCDTSLYKFYGVYADYCHSSYYHRYHFERKEM